MVYLK